MRRDPPTRSLPSVTLKRVRGLRRDSTHAEKLLWSALRLRQLASCKFRRQFPVGKFIADFCCVERRLLIELDGGQHDARAIQDVARTRKLAGEGWRVIRFWNNEVLRNLDGVLGEIFKALAEKA